MKKFNKRFEDIKYKIWQYMLTNYKQKYTSSELAEIFNEPVELIRLALYKLQQEERVICENKYWSINWPWDPKKYGHTVSEFVVIEWCLHLIKLLKEGKIKPGTEEYEEARRAYNVIKKFLE